MIPYEVNFINNTYIKIMINKFSTLARNISLTSYGMKNKNINKQKGQAMLIIVVLFMFISMTIVLGIATPILTAAKIEKELLVSKQSYFSAESALEDVFYRLKFGKQLSSPESLNLNGGSVSTTITNTPNGKQMIATANVSGDIRKMQANIVLGTGISFHYGVQSGVGGFVLQNSSSVTGNIDSGGTVTGAGNNIYGDIISAGSSGLVDRIHSTGNVFAHTITGSTIDKDAYYTIISGSTVSGILHPGSADQPMAPLPISDAQIAEWESDAAFGGTATCSGGTYTISSSITIGPKKIPCDLIIKGSGIVVTVNGPLWVTGNITTQVSPTIKMAASLGSQNVAIIADNPSNRSGSGIIDIGNNTAFQGSGAVGSFVFMISQNNSAEIGSGTNAIEMGQGASALVAYASHGQITLSQSVSVKEVTAYKIILQNTANVTYDTGLPSTLFESGPSGGYDITSWGEVQ